MDQTVEKNNMYEQSLKRSRFKIHSHWKYKTNLDWIIMLTLKNTIL